MDLYWQYCNSGRQSITAIWGTTMRSIFWGGSLRTIFRALSLLNRSDNSVDVGGTGGQRIGEWIPRLVQVEVDRNTS